MLVGPPTCHAPTSCVAGKTWAVARVRRWLLDNHHVIALSRPIAAVVILVALSGCDGDASRPPTPPTDSPFASATPLERETARCANQEDAVTTGSRLGGDVAADVTGDGSEDLAYLVRDEDADPGCRDFLVVETEDGPLVTPLSDPGQDYSLPAPRINALVSVDDEEGAEILVDLEQGASTQFVGMFTVTEGSLQRVRVRDRGIDDLFPYGGSVGHIEASDCGREAGTVIVSVATPLRDRYEVERTVYRFQDAELVPDEDASETVMLAPQRLIGLPEFQASPFGNCLRS